MSKPEPLGGEPLVVCDLCQAVISKASGTRKQLEGSAGHASVWVCKTCMRLGSQEQTRKYIMKEEKTAGR